MSLSPSITAKRNTYREYSHFRQMALCPPEFLQIPKPYFYTLAVGLSAKQFTEVKASLEAGKTRSIQPKFGPPVEVELKEGRMFVKNVPGAEVLNVESVMAKGGVLRESAWFRTLRKYGPPATQNTEMAYFTGESSAVCCDLQRDVTLDMVRGGLARLE